MRQEVVRRDNRVFYSQNTDKLQKPFRYWKNIENQTKCIEEIANCLRIFFSTNNVLYLNQDIQTLDDWYKVQHKQVEELGGRSLLRQYSGSMSKSKRLIGLTIMKLVLKEIYPSHNWDVSKFVSLPHRYWEDVNNQRKFFDDLASKLSIHNHCHATTITFT